MKVGEIYEITPEWTQITGNPDLVKLMPELKAGARFEIMETEGFLGKSDCVAIRNVETGVFHHVESSPIGHKVWCFFSHYEAKRGFIKLVGESK
ncbi:hypothetical protein ACX818_001474 [Acinetobacter baumannii]